MSDDLATMTDVPGTAASWLSQIEHARHSVRDWASRCDKIRKRYRYENSSEARVRRYQLLWSNMETMKPAVYTKTPQAAVLRRWKDKDPTARVASEMLERCINYTLEENDYNARFKQVRDDFLLYARGVARLYYEPVMGDDPAYTGTENLDEVSMDGEPVAPPQIVTFEHVKITYVQREDFINGWARTWDEVPWIAFRSFLTRKELRRRFADVAERISLDASPDRPEGSGPAADHDSEDKATIWEIWDRAGDQVLWVAKGYADILEQSEPYLKLSGFFPCPKPAFGTLTNDTLEPIPDYTYYQDQCEEIDALTARMAAILEGLKVVGFYSAGPNGEEGSAASAIEMAIKPGFENKLIGIPSLASLKEGGSGALIEWLPIDQAVKVLESCVAARQQLIDDVYQIYGLSDIMRGDGNASETATAQSIKAQFGSVRIRDRQDELARFCRDVCRMVGEIICAHFQPETLMAMANMPLPTDAEIQQQQMMAALQAQAAQQQGPMGLGGGGTPQMQLPPQSAPQQQGLQS